MPQIIQLVNERYFSTITSEIMNCAYHGHFTIPWGQGRGFDLGSDVIEAGIVGHMIMTTWQM